MDRRSRDRYAEIRRHPPRGEGGPLPALSRVRHLTEPGEGSVARRGGDQRGQHNEVTPHLARSARHPLPKSLRDNLRLRVIPRSRRRRGISQCVEKNQSEIPRSARNDMLDQVCTQTPRERAMFSTSVPLCPAEDMGKDQSIEETARPALLSANPPFLRKACRGVSSKCRDFISYMSSQVATHSSANRWLVSIAVLSSAIMEVLDTSVVNVSLPHIAGSL